jgi:hypothetical protein
MIRPGPLTATEVDALLNADDRLWLRFTRDHGFISAGISFFTDCPEASHVEIPLDSRTVLGVQICKGNTYKSGVDFRPWAYANFKSLLLVKYDVPRGPIIKYVVGCLGEKFDYNWFLAVMFLQNHSYANGDKWDCSGLCEFAALASGTPLMNHTVEEPVCITPRDLLMPMVPILDAVWAMPPARKS